SQGSTLRSEASIESQSKSRKVPLTRPDLILQPGPAAQIGAGRRAMQQPKVTFLLCTDPDIPTSPPQCSPADVAQLDRMALR
ncbi:hypothetical protein, partial [Rhizobium ruizarguesonis]|uniref:hypothetical protein n=1 Tax=Rhizobium ruizarguesonis TaxID=2081791 RepID=UPI001953E1D8